VTALHVLAFGDLGPAAWGVSWIPDPGTPARLAVRRGSSSAVLEGELDPGRPEDLWRFESGASALAFTPLVEPQPSQDPEDHLELRDQVCEVTGSVRIDDQDTEVSCLGWRSSAEADAELSQWDSVRFLAGWLDPRRGFSLLALRPRKARGHEADTVAVTLLEDPPRGPVVDPRLSTTYTEEGVPAKAGLELWLAEADQDDSEESTAPQYPRRAAGEAVGGGLDWSQGDFRLHASLLRWHSHGQDGPGVYLLGER
jgi:hypothetical protein